MRGVCCPLLRQQGRGAIVSVGRFFLGTLGVHTSDGLAFGEFTGYYGGVMGSYEVGNKSVYDYNLRLQIINVYFSATYTLGQSTFIASQGVSIAIASIENERKDFSGNTTAISYVFYPKGKRFIFFGQARFAKGRINVVCGSGILNGATGTPQ